MSTATTHALEITRTFNAPIDRVWRAWTEVEAMRQWMAPEGMDVARLEADVRPGGRYLIQMAKPGESFTVEGEYREVVPTERLSYTWAWQHEPGVPPSLVEVRFAPSGTGTTVLLRHTGFTTEEAVTGHDEGWTSCLGRLEGSL